MPRSTVNDEEARILGALCSGPKTTREVARGERCGVGMSYDLAPLHALWKAGRIRWDWGSERWALPEAA